MWKHDFWIYLTPSCSPVGYAIAWQISHSKTKNLFFSLFIFYLFRVKGPRQQSKALFHDKQFLVNCGEFYRVTTNNNIALLYCCFLIEPFLTSFFSFSSVQCARLIWLIYLLVIGGNSRRRMIRRLWVQILAMDSFALISSKIVSLIGKKE